MEGKTQETAAAKAGMSVRSARKWQSGPLPSQAKPEHRWGTRPDPLTGCGTTALPAVRRTRRHVSGWQTPAVSLSVIAVSSRLRAPTYHWVRLIEDDTRHSLG